MVGKITVTLSKFVSHIDRSFPLSIAEGGIGIFGCCFGNFLDRFSGFCANQPRFSVLVFIAVCGFLVFQHSVFGFREK